MIDFTGISSDRIIYEDDYFFIIQDAYPVSPGHLLIISKRVVSNYFDLNPSEQFHLGNTITKAKSLIEQSLNPQGYNIGMNCGEVAGQTVMHFHCHIIPRYLGDISNPRGGVRGVIPEKKEY
jgi:diadenosine tetraphosphate (Ap4A) HIT family hydrolase